MKTGNILLQKDLPEKTDRGHRMCNQGVVFILAMVCCILWGSAFPCVKLGYRLFGIGTSDTFTQIAFAGIRFLLAGILALIIGSTAQKKWLVPAKWEIPRIVKLCLFQTVLQYFFFYLGLARTTGVKASIIEAANVFVAILVSSLIFRMERLTLKKMAGCIIGFAGVVLINLNSAATGMDLHMSLTGEGFVFFSTVAYAFSSVLTKKYAKESNPVLLAAYQFMAGGLIMAVTGLAGGGRLQMVTGKGIAMLLYLAFVSAAAFSVWGMLLKYNPVSKVAVYGFMNPMFGVILSALLLKEQGDAMGTGRAVIALLLVTAGIVIVNINYQNRGKITQNGHKF